MRFRLSDRVWDLYFILPKIVSFSFESNRIAIWDAPEHFQFFSNALDWCWMLQVWVLSLKIICIVILYPLFQACKGLVVSCHSSKPMGISLGKVLILIFNTIWHRNILDFSIINLSRHKTGFSYVFKRTGGTRAYIIYSRDFAIVPTIKKMK